MSTVDRVRTALEGLAFEEAPGPDGILCLRVSREIVREVLERLKERAGFASVTFVTGTDHLPRAPRFEVHHQLFSVDHVDRVRVTTPLEESDPKLPTCIDLWPGAAFMERECFDMFGIVFEGHHALRRLLMPEGYGHHPLRKDFPHAGIEPDRLYREWDRQRRAGADPAFQKGGR